MAPPSAILHEPFTDTKKIGFVLILLGVFGIAWGTGAAVNSGQSIGHALFLGSALAWACYTVAMRRARLEGLHAAGIAAVGALILYTPVYLFVEGMTSLARAPWEDLALQAVVQGVLTAIASLVFYGRAVSILGASSGAAFAALSPAMTAVMAALRNLGIPFDNYLRLPVLVTEEDFRAAHHVVAVKEAEHRPMIERKFFKWLERVEFWHVDDLDCCGPKEAIPHLDQEVAKLMERLMTK